MIQQVSVEEVTVTKKVVANSNRFGLLGIMGKQTEELNRSTEGHIETLPEGNERTTNSPQNKNPLQRGK